MRKGEKKLLIIFVLLFITYVATDFLAPKPIDWTVTFRGNDKNPFGGYILNERSQDIFGEKFEASNLTISEISFPKNLLVLADAAEIAGVDYRSLLAKLDSGTNVFIAANYFSQLLIDSLGIDLSFSFHPLNQTIFEAATSDVYLGDTTSYEFPFSIVSNYFLLGNDTTWEKHASLENHPVLISKAIGSGKLILSSTPYIFTNFGLLYDKNYAAAAEMLSLLPEEPTHLTLYYQLGKGEATTPFRYFLSQAPLRWSLYLVLFVVVIFLVITSRRVQRPIPVVTPPENTTVNYVKTLGALFYREGNHKKAAQRLVNYFLRDLKEKYYLSIDYSEKFYKNLSHKVGVDVGHVVQTFDLILKIRDVPYVDEKTLIELSKKIEKFK